MSKNSFDLKSKKNSGSNLAYLSQKFINKQNNIKGSLQNAFANDYCTLGATHQLRAGGYFISFNMLISS